MPLRASAIFLAVVFALSACSGPAAPTPSPTTTITPGPSLSPAPPAVATVQELVEADVAAGRLDAQTGLMYRIYATFGVPNLPEPYRAAAASEDAFALMQAKLTFNELRPEIQEEVKPFLVRPTDPASAFPRGGDTSAFMPRAQAGLAVMVAGINCGPEGWARVNAPNVPIVVWGPCDENGAPGIDNMIAAAEEIYPKEKELMGEPIWDSNDLPEEFGGDPFIDIYLTGRCITRWGACQTLKGLDENVPAVAEVDGKLQSTKEHYRNSGFIIADGAKMTDLTMAKGVFAHEMFHILAWKYNSSGMRDGPWESALGQHWWVEASASWATEAYAPAARQIFPYPWWRTFQASPLSLSSTEGQHEYGAFIWPYFMVQEESPQVIQAAWAAMVDKSGGDAVDAALASTFSFEENFKEFAVRDLNTTLEGMEAGSDPIAPRFQLVDNLLPTDAPGNARNSLIGPFEAQDEGAPPARVPESVPPLAVRYRQVGLAGGAQKLVIDFTSLGPAQALDVEALVRVRERGWRREPLLDGKNTICLDRPEWQIQELILIIANHSYSRAEALGDSFTVKASTKACVDGTFSIDLAGDMAYAGHYDGEGEISCRKDPDGWVIGGSFPDVQNGTPDGFDIEPGLVSVGIQGQTYMGEANWLVGEAPYGAGTVTFTVDENVSPAAVTASGVEEGLRIDIKATCSTVVHMER